MTQAVWRSVSHHLTTNLKCNVAEFGQMGTADAPLTAKLKRIEKLSACRGFTYLAPLVVSRAICVFRCFRSSVPEKTREKFPLTRLQALPKRWSVKSMAFLEFRLGPYLLSLNHL